jgi:hypothetical protein
MASHQHDENCKKMFALLSEYLDLELPAEACKVTVRAYYGM